MRPYRFFGAAIAAAALAALSAQVASARTLPAPVATPTPIPSASSPLPYPAYGRPAPSVSATKVRPGIPPRVTLAQSLAIAAASSPVLAAARANYRLAKVPVNLAKSAIFPSVTGQASITRTGGALVFGGSSFRSGQRAFVSKGISLNVRQLIYDGGKVIAEIHSAKATESGAADTYERELQTLAYDVAQAYYSALQAERATSLAVQVVHQNEVQENLVRAQIRAGTTAPADLMTAELPTAQARVALVKAQGAELSSLAAFANVLGLDADTRIRPADDTPAGRAATLLHAPVLPHRTALKRALALRPDYLAAERTVEADQYTLQAQRLGRFPVLTATASTGANSTNPVNGTQFLNANSIGAQISLPIFDQGVTAAYVAQAAAVLDTAEAQLRSAKLGIQLGVRQALVGLVSAQAALGETQAELNTAQEVLKATQAQYRAGVTTLPLLLNAQVGLTQAETDRLNAVYALRQAEQTYAYALGESDLMPAGP